MKRINWAGKSIYRKIIIIISALQALAFFVVPFATLSGAMSALNNIAGSLTGESAPMPKWLTSFSMVKLAVGPYGAEIGEQYLQAVCAGMFLGALLVPLLVFLVNLFNRRKAGYVVGIIFSIELTFRYAVFFIAFNIASGELYVAGYKTTFFALILSATAVVQFVLSIIGLVKLKDEIGATDGVTVKQGKYDGTLTGIKGSYAGAVIPLKGGNTVFIGRDPKACSIVIKGENVSRKHCSVTYDAINNSYSVTDYSVNGVYDRRGRRLEEGRTNMMAPGDEIHIGATDEIFRLG